MGGVDLGLGGNGARRSLDSELNMIPMIDLLMVTISFLLITAVWSHMSRLNADARVPGPPGIATPASEKQLHVTMPSADKFVLVWKDGTNVVDSIDVPRKETFSRAKALSMWCASLTWPQRSTANGEPKGSTQTPETCASIKLSCTPTIRWSFAGYIVAVIDADLSDNPEEMRLAVARLTGCPAFNITFAID